MVSSKATTVDEFLVEIPSDRQAALQVVRRVILENLPAGYKEGMQYGMIGYFIPLSDFPHTYNGQPLGYAALASQKNYMSLYLNNIYSDEGLRQWFQDGFKASGKKLDMGKSCVRFKRLADLPLDLIGEAIAKTPPDQFIQIYKHSRKGD